MNENDEKEEESPEKETKRSILESVEWVVDMMNSGKVNPKDVYPPGRYQGD